MFEPSGDPKQLPAEMARTAVVCSTAIAGGLSFWLGIFLTSIGALLKQPELMGSGIDALQAFVIMLPACVVLYSLHHLIVSDAVERQHRVWRFY